MRTIPFAAVRPGMPCAWLLLSPVVEDVLVVVQPHWCVDGVITLPAMDARCPRSWSRQGFTRFRVRLVSPIARASNVGMMAVVASVGHALWGGNVSMVCA